MTEPFLTIERMPDDNIRTKCQIVFDDPFAFGMVFVDAARTIALSYAKDDQSISSAEYLKRIREGFDAEWEHMTTDIQFGEADGGSSEENLP